MNIDQIASKHLGRTADGAVMTPYVTPMTKDASLLVPIPRELNRIAYGITAATRMTGRDVWNCYETTFLMGNGFPVTCITTIEYPSESENIVESKSLKLYLNSYNMMKIAGDDVNDACGKFEVMVEQDLMQILGLNVFVRAEPTAQFSNTNLLVRKQFVTIEEILDLSNIEFTAYNENRDLLQLVEYDVSTTLRLHSAVLRSNCRVTNQPDFGDVYVHIKSDLLVTPESLLQYLVSFRNENHFHEECCEMIYKRLLDICDPDELFVQCNYTRRGGIDINPTRATTCELLYELTNSGYARSGRQ